ncbi:helix-turn-helix domain-containing protein [Congregibacter litoralis]|uniref:Putative Zn peptidase n=1 Tax=Congregibacter litoralis KT71 TaxID=314285 RepID=A4ACT1_9GAMM|nr:XRE family transcriptional regulator [Congregibacter litoralis]EAQ96122.2 putative Zn peptidase [Congregibacter litoralis KT71]
MPAKGVDNFVGQRLVQAKNVRGLSSLALSELIEVSQSSISLYESGKQKPRQEVVESLATALRVPVSYFFKPASDSETKTLFYRSMAAATKASRVLVEAKYSWARDLTEYVLEFIDFPPVNLPSFDIPADFRQLEVNQIESIANELRTHWNLGSAPIADVIRTLESNGVIVWRTCFESEKLDAFSESWKPHPFVVLSTDKDNYFRSRFDAAHELGHLVLHQQVQRKHLTDASDYKLLESQAHRFAGAFLTPAIAYSNDLYDLSVDVFRALKPRWNVTIAMQIMRAHQLGLIDEEQKRRLYVGLSRRKWRKREPLDDTVEPEKPSLLKKSVKLLLDEEVKTKEQLMAEISLSGVDLDILIDEPGLFSVQDGPSPKLRNIQSNIIPFRRQ